MNEKEKPKRICPTCDRKETCLERALGIHYMLERAVKCYNTRRDENPWYCSDFYLKPYFPTPENYDGYNPCGFRDYSRRMKNY